MKKLFGTLAVLLGILAGVVLASTFTQVEFGPVVGNDIDVLTITSAGSSSDTITVTNNAVIEVLNFDGTLANPQPALTIDPTQGTAAHVYTIKCRSENVNFPNGGKIRISRIDSTSTSPPTGAFSDQN